MPSINISRLNQGINEAKKLIEEFQSSRDQGERPDESSELLFISQAERGGLTLWGDSITQYSQCLDILHEAIRGPGEGQWGLRTVEVLLQDTIFASLDILQAEPESKFEERLQLALQGLKSALTAPTTTREFYCCVLGMDVSNSSARFGKIKFFPGDDENINLLCDRANNIISRSPDDDAFKAKFKADNNERFPLFLKGKTIAFIEVSAGDIESAHRLALQEIQKTLDVINFFVLGVSNVNLRMHAYLPGATERGRTLDVAFAGNERVDLQYSIRGPRADFELASLNGTNAVKFGMMRLHQILCNNSRNKFEECLLIAARIAGKATGTIRREDAFLLYAIALESILVGGKETTDITYKLSTRCAHLLGQNLELKKKIKNEISKLYGIRSAIVHRGENNFTDLDLNLIRRHVQNVLVALLTKSEFKDYTTKEDLNQWFDEKMLT